METLTAVTTMQLTLLKIAAIAALVTMALLFGGVALMLWAVTGVGHPLLWAVPLSPMLALVMVLLWPLAKTDRWGVAASVKRQVDEDLQLFRDLC